MAYTKTIKNLDGFWKERKEKGEKMKQKTIKIEQKIGNQKNKYKTSKRKHKEKEKILRKPQPNIFLKAQ